MKKLFDAEGFTLVEVIVTVALIGAIIIPLMNMFVLSMKINGHGEIEYKSIQTAQYYMEEIKSKDKIDMSVYFYNEEEGCYKRIITDDDNDFITEIRISQGSYGIHYINVDVIKDGETLNSLIGSVIFDCVILNRR